MSKLLGTKSIIASSVGVITFIIFIPALLNDFIDWDDNEYVYENLFIRSLDSQLLKSAFGGFHSSNWHPLTWISHAVDYAFWGLNPMGHHLTNNILHSLNALLVVLLVMRFLAVFKENDGLPQSFLNERTIVITGVTTGLLFGIHPLHVESVAWVSERKDLLCAFFFLLSVMSYVSYRSYATYKTYILSLALFILALLSKPMAVTLPFILLLLDWYLFRKIWSLKTFFTAFIEKLPFFVLTITSAIITVWAQKAGESIAPVAAVPLSSRLVVATESLTAYVVKMLLPLNLVPFYPYPENIYFFSFEHIIPIFIVIAITSACLAMIRKERLWIAVWSYYVITLVPVLGIVQVGGQSMADRYTYLPSLGPFVILGLIAAGIDKKVSALNRQRIIFRIAGLLIAAALLVSISYATIKQIGIWKNSIIFWNYAIDKKLSRVPFAYNSLGSAYLDKGLTDLAIKQFQTALRLDPDYAEAHNNLGNAYQFKKLFDMAIEQYKIALRLKPVYAEAHNNLGYAYSSKGLTDLAIEHYETALRLKPDYPEAYFNYGRAYSSKGLTDLAIEHYKTALMFKPDYTEAYNNLGNAYQSKKLFDMAIEQYKIALRLKPDYAEAHNNLGSAYMSKGMFDMATEQFLTALTINRGLAGAYFNLGLIYLNKGFPDKARIEFESALKINPADYRSQQLLNSIISK